jgi:hypothetical protein
MPDVPLIPEPNGQREVTRLLDAIPCDGIDTSAEWRAHMRDLTMARQAAERLYARPPAQARWDRVAQARDAQERATDLRTELARINAEHRRWLQARGETEPEEPARHQRLKKVE